MKREEMIKTIMQGSLEFFPFIKEGMVAPPKLEEMNAPKLSSLQFMTVTFLYHMDRQERIVTMNILTKFLGISKQQCTKLVDNLVDFGLVTRYLNPNNRREVIVTISLEGKNCVYKMQKMREQNLTQKYEVLTDEELENLMNLLNESLKILAKTRMTKEK